MHSCGESTKRTEHRADTIPVDHHQRELKQTVYDFDNPPEFRKDGELLFIEKESDDVKNKLNVEIASTDFQRQMGLMYRAEMEHDFGMLFLFDREVIQSFWMRNTKIPLDIIYVNSNRQIVDIHSAADTMSNTSYPSAEPAIYVVEVNLGYCEKHNINIGDRINF